jgi:hypothetical protein
MSEGTFSYAVNIGKDSDPANNFHFVKNASNELELRKGEEGGGGAVVLKVKDSPIVPSYTTTQKNALVSPQAGMIILDSTLAKVCIYTGVAWQTVTSA